MDRRRKKSSERNGFPLQAAVTPTGRTSGSLRTTETTLADNFFARLISTPFRTCYVQKKRLRQCEGGMEKKRMRHESRLMELIPGNLFC